MPGYRHTQVGWLVIVAVGATMALLAVLMLVNEFVWMNGAVLVVLGVCLLLFSWLNVEVGDTAVRVWFGPGLVSRKVLFEEVESCRRVRNKWYYGWGIRLVPGGLMFNVSGLDAVELKLRSGRVFRIGTDEPDRLVQALGQRLARPRTRA